MRHPLRLALLTLAASVVALALPLRAQVLDHNGHGASPDTEDASQVGHHSEFRNEFMLFLGDTRKGGENAFTVGFDYLRELSVHWGVGIFLDYATAHGEREYIAGAGLFWAPLGILPDLHLFAGAGYERLEEDHGGEWEGENLLLGRFGATYVIHLGSEGHWVVAPQGFWDVVEEGNNAYVFGVGVGYLF